MTTHNELNEEVHRITELTNVLRYLFKDRSMCDAGACCDLFYTYMELVKKHIAIVDTEMYSDLLQSPEESVNNVAKNFMSGSIEIKRILKDFTKSWCPARKSTSLRIKDHDKFIVDTDQLFDMILQRIQDETEHLYPLVRNLNTDRIAASVGSGIH